MVLPSARTVRILAILVVLGALVALRIAFHDKASPEAAVAELRAIRDEWWSLPAYVALYLSLTTAFFPAVLFHLAAGAAWGFGFASVTNVVVMNLAATLQFFLARKLGRERVAGLVKRYGLLKLDERAAKQGVRTMMAIRAIPLPSMLVNASAGVSGMTWRDFALGTLFGALPYILIYTYFAAAIADGVAGAQRRAIIQGALAGGVIVLLAVVPRLLAARMRKAAGLKGTPAQSGPGTPDA